MYHFTFICPSLTDIQTQHIPSKYIIRPSFHDFIRLMVTFLSRFLICNVLLYFNYAFKTRNVLKWNVKLFAKSSCIVLQARIWAHCLSYNKNSKVWMSSDIKHMVSIIRDLEFVRVLHLRLGSRIPNVLTPKTANQTVRERGQIFLPFMLHVSCFVFVKSYLTELHKCEFTASTPGDRYCVYQTCSKKYTTVFSKWFFVLLIEFLQDCLWLYVLSGHKLVAELTMIRPHISICE